jgi:drug/metabolite transporter (DMT)-like permease
VYIIWGSTYLAIRFALETLPAFTFAGARFLTAGAVLYAFGRATGAERPRRVEWRSATIVGACLLLGGNGCVVWAEQTVPSGMAALLVATMPLFMAAMTPLALFGGGRFPGVRGVVELLVGLAGVAVLIGPGLIPGRGSSVDLAGVGALMVACLTWAGGSLWSRHAPLPKSALLATGMEMLAGGALLLLTGGLLGEWARVDLSAVSARSWLALLYLITFGSLIGYTAYIWLLRNTTPSLASTYAYVNPLVAVLLGWALAGETISARIVVAAALIIASVVLITRSAAADRRRVAPVPSSAAGTTDSVADR